MAYVVMATKEPLRVQARNKCKRDGWQSVVIVLLQHGMDNVCCLPEIRPTSAFWVCMTIVYGYMAIKESYLVKVKQLNIEVPTIDRIVVSSTKLMELAGTN